MKKKDWIGLVLPLPLLFGLAFWLSPLLEGNALDWIGHFTRGDWKKVPDSVDRRTWMVFFLLLGVYGLLWLSRHFSRHAFRYRVEYGSAGWGDLRAFSKKYRQTPAEDNKILSRNCWIGLDTHRHRRNLNTIVIGGSGSGKSRSYVLPNLLQNSPCSVVVTDPKGELLRSAGPFLMGAGYRLRVLNLLNMELSDRYNPFAYLPTDNDVQRLVTNLFRATDGSEKRSSDPFWDITAGMLLMALVFLVRDRAIPEEQNFTTVLELLRAGEVNENNPKEVSVLDEEFDELEKLHPGHVALKYYRNYRSGSGKTLKSIQVSLASRLEKFNLDSLAALTGADEMHLETVGQEKTALFAILPDNDSSFNFLVSILYTQLFQQLFAQADAQSSGELPLPVHLLMDEFANVSLPTDFDKILSVMRSRGIYVSILLQNLAQLKKLYEKEWESILGNCDELVYLGGNEPSTHKFLSEALGRETIDLENRDVSGGTTKSVSKHHQVLGRDLLTPDEIRKLSNEKSLILVRGESPILDDKYRIESHPNYKIIQKKEERGPYMPHRFRPDQVTVCTDEDLWEDSGIPTLEAFVRSREMRYQ